MQKTTFNIPDLNNTNSALEVKNAIISLAGVSYVAIDVNTSEVSITFDPNTTDVKKIKEQIVSTGHYTQ